MVPSGPAVQPEPVSPELVLIDPELARRERARLEEKAYLQSVVDAPPLRQLASEPPAPLVAETASPTYWRDAASFSKRRLFPAALMCSLLANGFLVAALVARKGEEAAQVAVRMVTLTENLRTTVSPISVPTVKSEASPATKVPTTLLITKGAVERKVISLILSAPARRLPRTFLDPTTGLVKNNVQVACRKRKQRSFLCAVRLPSDKASKALYVSYQMVSKGHGVFRWYGYRRS